MIVYREIGEITINRNFITNTKIKKLFEQAGYSLVLKVNGLSEWKYTIIEKMLEETEVTDNETNNF